MNLSQTLTKTMPEFGNMYGGLLMLRGAARVRGIRNLNNYLQKAEKMGLAPVRKSHGVTSYLDTGVFRSKPVESISKLTNLSSDIAMLPYTWAETANRSIAIGMAEMMAHDLLGKSKMAQSALRRFPTSLRSRAEAAIANGDQKLLTKELATHIVNSTQYQYNKLSQSEYGRTMGPLFSAFSKWPTATLGQIIEGYRTRGLAGGTAQLARTMVVPLMLLEAGDYIIGQYSPEGLSEREQKLFGSTGLSQAAPVGNIKAIATGDFFSPPIIDTAVKTFINPLDKNAGNKLRRALGNALYGFAPGGIGGYVRFITDDAVTLATGHIPEGGDFVERSVKGADTISQKLP
jgi:hypothetical protein